jgi:anti-sigma factor RsiW
MSTHDDFHADAHLTDAQIDDYADGALDAAARSVADRHLASCARCRVAVDETRAVLAWSTRERAAVAAPPDLWPLVAASTVHVALVRRRVLASMRGVLVVAALALTAATAVVTWKVARWTAAPREVARPSSGAVHGRHPTAPVPPRPPEPPKPPRSRAP